jgi:glucosylceramidase
MCLNTPSTLIKYYIIKLDYIKEKTYNMDVMFMKKYVTEISKNIKFKEDELVNVKTIDEELSINLNNTTSFFSGMGAALTPASTINYKKLDSYNRNKFINAYFKDLKYKYIRLPIGSCDFSEYSYDYYKPFGINMREDEINIEPLLDAIRNFHPSFLASPWTPPRIWKYPILNRLRRLCFGRYAKYLINYIKYYKEQGINIDFLSIQNEPHAYQRWESCVWSNHGMKVFIKYYMIPLLKKNNLNTTIMLHDHNKDNLLNSIDKVYVKDDKVGAIAFHWYTGSHFDELKKVHKKYPQLLLIESEMSCGFSPYNEIEWINDAELYANEIIGNINNGMNIFLDWNLLLDENGGPNHKKNYVKAPILRHEDEIIITPIYHYLKHISCHREQLIYKTKYKKLKLLASMKDDSIVITVLNNSNEDITYSIDNILKDKINKHSIITYYIEQKELTD